MSTLASLLQPSPQAQPLARSRFKLLSSRLSSSTVFSFENETHQKFAASWIAAVEETASVNHLPDSWVKSLNGQFQSDAASQLLKGSVVARMLSEIEQHIPDADVVSAWAQMDNAISHLSRRENLAVVDQQRQAIAQRVIKRVEAVYGQGDRMEADLDFASLEQGLVKFFEAWSKTEVDGSTNAAITGIYAFYSHVIAKHDASSEAWQLLLQSLSSDADLSKIGIEDLVNVLTESLPRFSTLRAIFRQTKQLDTALPEDVSAIVIVHVILTAAPASRLTQHVSAQLQFDRIAAALTQGGPELNGSLKKIREGLRQKLEQYQLDWWENAWAWVQKISETEQTLKDHAKELEGHAVQSFAESQDARRLASLAQELIGLAVRTGNGALDPSHVAPIFRAKLVLDYGCDPTVAPWTHSADLSEGTLNVLKSLGTNRLFLPARAQVRKLTETIQQIGQYSLSAARSAADSWTPRGPLTPDADLNVRCQRDIGFLLQRVAMEHRIARPLNAQNTLLHWYADQVAVHLAHLPNQDLIHHWQDLCGSSTSSLSAELREAAEKTEDALPRLTTALKLIRDHEDLGRQAAEHVMAKLPDYHQTVGETGVSLCARDNSLTLLQAGRILLSGVEDPAEQLAGWWNAVVATYIVNRPTQLFEANLQGLHSTLRDNLAPAEVDTIFPVLHQVYKESLGIQDLPLLFFREDRDTDLIAAYAPDSKGHEVLPEGGPKEKFVKHVGAMVAGSDKATVAAFSSFLNTIESSFAVAESNEQAWAKLRPQQQSWLEKDTAINLIRCHAMLANRGALSNSKAGRDLAQFALQGVRFVAQDALASQLETGWAVQAGPRIAAAATSGGGDEVAQQKCARDLQLMNEFLIRQLRTQSFETAALNTVRFLIECVVPFVNYDKDTWSEVFRDWQRSHDSKVDDVSRPLFEALTKLLSESAAKFAGVHQICAATFKAGSTTFSHNVTAEKTLRSTFSLALIHSMAPNTGTLNRDVLCKTGFRRGARSTHEIDEIFGKLVLHVDRLFDQVEGDIYYEIQEVLPSCREIYADVATASVPPEPEAALATLLAETDLDIGVFKKLTRVVSGPKEEEMAGALWRSIMASHLGMGSLEGNAAQTELLAFWLQQAVPPTAQNISSELSAKFMGAAGSAHLPEALKAFLQESETAAA
ncbi:MAG: hypothetical protein SynsKO_36040 [Synoicihabitans sp.]